MGPVQAKAARQGLHEQGDETLRPRPEHSSTISLEYAIGLVTTLKEPDPCPLKKESNRLKLNCWFPRATIYRVDNGFGE